MAVPERGDTTCGPAAGEEVGQGGSNGGGVGADEAVGADGAGFGTLGVVAQGQAGNVHNGGFLSYAARVGNNGH